MLARPSGNRTVFCTRARGHSRATGPTMTATTASGGPDQGPRRPLAVPGGEQDRRDQQSGPRGGLHGGGHPQGKASRYRMRLAPQQRQPQAQAGEHRYVGAAHGQRERDYRRRGHQHGPAHHVLGAGRGKRRGKHDQEPEPEPDPRVGQHREAQQGAGHAEQRHRRQVGIEDVRAVRGGERRGPDIRGALVHEHGRRLVDHPHLRLLHPGIGHQHQRHDQRPAEADQQGRVHPARPPRQDHHGGEQVGAGRENPPQPVQVVVGYKGHHQGIRSRRGEEGGRPDPGNRGRRRPVKPACLGAPQRHLPQREHRHAPSTDGDPSQSTFRARVRARRSPRVSTRYTRVTTRFGRRGCGGGRVRVMHTVAVVLAGGSGERFGTHVPKQLLPLAGRALIEHSVTAFEQAPGVDAVLVVMTAGHIGRADQGPALGQRIPQAHQGHRRRADPGGFHLAGHRGTRQHRV